MTNLNGPRRVRAVRHVAAILRALAGASRPLNATELAHRVGVSKTAIYYLLLSLEDERLVARGADGSYRLSWGLYELGGAVFDAYELTRVMRPHLDALSEETKEAGLVAILEGDSALYLDRSQSDLRFTMLALPGRRAPLHCSASGKLLLAYKSADFINTALRAPLERMTSATITDPDALRHDLDRIREQDYATCWQETEVGLNSFAVAVRDFSGEVCAALTVVTPAPRVTPANLPDLVAVLQRHATAASAQLGDTTRPSVSSRGPRRAI